MNILYDVLDHGDLGNNPKRIIVHAMGENITDGEIVLPARDFLDKYKLSAHILCKPDGDLIMCRPDNETAWHARGHNRDTLGIEILVPGNHNYSSFLKAIKKKNWATEEQMVSAAAQVREWMELYHIPLDNVLRHSDISPDRKVDPGSGFNWVRFKKLLTPMKVRDE